MPASSVGALVSALALALALGGCGKTKDQAPEVADQPLLVYPQDIFVLDASRAGSGPLITGSIQPQRRADLRAEVSAVVLQVFKDNGDAVRRGDVLVRLDDTAIRDNLTSAEAAVRAAGQSLEQAEHQYQRLKTLRQSGMVTTQQLEDAELRRNNARSDQVAAQARLVQARQQLERTFSRAPFDGVVSERKVSRGDTAQPGKELLKVIDLASLRFEGLVSGDAVHSVSVGQRVNFRVNGYGTQEFVGKVARIDPAANASTRQVGVLVDFANGVQPKLAGLYAEGYLEAERSSSVLMVPAVVLAHEGDKVFAWRIAGTSLQKVALELGERDPRRGDFVLRAGLSAGDRLLRNPISTFRDGQKVELGTAAPGQAAVAPGAGK